MILQDYIAPKWFYEKVAKIALPSALQHLLSSAMGIVDTIMVSQIGQVTAVGTAAQIETLVITVGFGAVTGTGIFASQFFGAKEYKNMKRVFGMSLLLMLGNGILWTILTLLGKRQILSIFISDPHVIESAMIYLSVVVFSYIPSLIGFAFSYMYRCTQKTHIPLMIGLVAMISNVIGNYVLIFGVFGFPKLGVQGAAISTLVAQWLGMIVHIVYAYKTKQPFIGSFQELFCWNRDFIRPVLKRTMPLVINEIFFGIGASLYITAFGILGKQAMDSYYVGNQIANVFLAIVIGVGQATAAILGSSLGQNKIEEAQTQSKYFVGLALVISLSMSVLIFGGAHPLVKLFGLTEAAVEQMAIRIIQITAIRIALRMFNVIVFSSLRAGGDARFLTFLDAGIKWMVGIPLAFILVGIFKLNNIALVFLLVQLEEVVRVCIGWGRLKAGNWAKNLTSEVSA